jgi:hypothetical protein
VWWLLAVVAAAKMDGPILVALVVVLVGAIIFL